ncbi:MAG: AbrB/MazE/SpoVT family DNA-binding domain-containing protein [Thaumarchaeota archaeon]|nr:AbrB/MazE/SpoVT family DNA-binding domain-containing protein [Nitrososphaerota archaeon]
MEVELKDKGRVTIPSKIRKALALAEGDRLYIEIGKGAIKLRPKKTVTADEIKGIAKIKKVNLEDIENALAGE